MRGCLRRAGRGQSLNRPPHAPPRGSNQAWPKKAPPLLEMQDLRSQHRGSCLLGVRGFKSRLPHKPHPLALLALPCAAGRARTRSPARGTNSYPCMICPPGRRPCTALVPPAAAPRERPPPRKGDPAPRFFEVPGAPPPPRLRAGCLALLGEILHSVPAPPLNGQGAACVRPAERQRSFPGVVQKTGRGGGRPVAAAPAPASAAQIAAHCRGALPCNAMLRVVRPSV